MTGAKNGVIQYQPNRSASGWVFSPSFTTGRLCRQQKAVKRQYCRRPENSVGAAFL